MKNLDHDGNTCTGELDVSDQISSSGSITLKIDVNQSGEFDNIKSDVIVEIEVEAFSLILVPYVEVET